MFLFAFFYVSQSNCNIKESHFTKLLLILQRALQKNVFTEHVHNHKLIK